MKEYVLISLMSIAFSFIVYMTVVYQIDHPCVRWSHIKYHGERACLQRE